MALPTLKPILKNNTREESGGNLKSFYMTFIDKFEEQLLIYLCSKNLDDMIYNSWDIECDRLKSVIMGLWVIFPFYRLRPHLPPCIKSWKIRILKKWKKLLEISSFYTCVQKCGDAE